MHPGAEHLDVFVCHGAIAASGQISVDKVAGPVGETLIMTAAGLAVAIPAVLAYNALSKRARRVQGE
ncbi:MAG: MotA/TolQ/ExbB proton channel family protein, partial [Flavobacteriales bacterium]